LDTLPNPGADDNEIDNGAGQAGGSIANSTLRLGQQRHQRIRFVYLCIWTNKDASLLGVYMVDPALNINDLNNTSADLGGALIVDLDSGLSGGMGASLPHKLTRLPRTSTATMPLDSRTLTNSIANASTANSIWSVRSRCQGNLFTAAKGADDSDPLGTLTGTAGE
jgi:hypothetical protein